MLDTKALAEATALIVREHVNAATAPLLARLEALEGRAAEAGPPGEPGRDAEPVSDKQIAAALAEYMARNPIPTPENGKDGLDGHSVEASEVERMVGEAVERAVAALPVARDGKDGADGVNVAGALIDRDGELVLTLSNGEVRALGRVVGRDGADGTDGANGVRGEAGFSLDDFDTEMAEDGRTVRFKFVRGDEAEIHEIAFPAMIYRGVFRDGETYARGDTVTWAGSLWHCDGETSERPGDLSKAWTLAAKRGRDGKDGAPGARGEAGKEGRPGRDLTQMGFNGEKH